MHGKRFLVMRVTTFDLHDDIGLVLGQPVRFVVLVCQLLDGLVLSSNGALNSST